MLLLWVFAFPSKAQITDFSFEYLSIKEGLPSNDTWVANKDSEGFLWVGTGKGICRYDGYVFSDINQQKTGYCSGISTDKNGNLYASLANSGLCKIDNKTLTISILQKVDFNDENLDNNHFERIFIDSKNRAWVCDLKQIKRINIQTNQVFKYALPESVYPEQIAHFFEDANHTLWVVSDVGLYRFDEKTNKLICEIGKNAIKKENQIETRLLDACQDDQQNLWIVSYGKGIIKFSLQTRQTILYSKGFENQSLTAIAPSVNSSGQRFFFVGSKDGLSVFYPETQKVIHLKQFHDKGIHVRSIFDDKENGFLWIMTREGIFKYRYKNLGIQVINLPENVVKFPVGIMSITTEPTGGYLLGLSHTGMMRYNPNKNTFQLIKYPINAFTYNIQLIDNQIVSFTDNGIFEMRGNKFVSLEKVKNAFSTKEFVGGIVDEKNRFWVANLTDGVKVFAKNSLTEIKIWNQEKHNKVFKNNYLKAIGKDKNGKIWIATCPNSLYFFDAQKNEFVLVKDLPINKNKTLAGLCNNNLAFGKDNSVLLASWGGINKISNTGEIQSTFEYEKDHLADSFAGNICEDHEGNFWFNTNEGIQIANPQTRSIKRLTSIEGLSSNISYSFFYNQHNQLFIGYNNAFNILNINALNSKSVLPKIVVSSVEIMGKNRNEDFSKEIVVNPNENAITFNFSTLNFEPSSKNIYKYQLVGYDDKWIDLANKNAISFTNLDPKTYQLKVKSGNTIGLWNSSPLILNIIVKPYYYETLWFKSFIAFLAIALIFGFLRWRVNTIHEKNQAELQMSELKLRALQSQMNPHFLFNSLNSVQNFLITNRGIEGAKYLSKFSKLVRKIMENSNHQYLRMEEMIETLKMYVEIESFRFSHEFEYEFDIEEEDNTLLDAQLPPMLLQPFIENAIWHGLMPKEGTKKLLIKAYHKNDLIYCIIEDNGVGRSQAPKKGGHISRGQEMTNGVFQLLASKNINAKLEIIDLFDAQNNPAGTRVEIIVPLIV